MAEAQGWCDYKAAAALAGDNVRDLKELFNTFFVYYPAFRYYILEKRHTDSYITLPEVCLFRLFWLDRIKIEINRT